MSKKFIAQLNDCPICGGKPQLKQKMPKGKHVTCGNTELRLKRQAYIRCSKCHIRTESFAQNDTLITAWNRGYLYYA